MGYAVHRKGDQYRVWSTYSDTYVTEPMTRDVMAKWLREDAFQTLEERIDRDTEVRLARADKCGSSGHPRDTDEWDTELCRCGRFHHTFELRASDGKCGHCGEPEEDIAHKPPCEPNPKTGLMCDECGEPQRRSPSGQVSCDNGHTSKGVFCG